MIQIVKRGSIPQEKFAVEALARELDPQWIDEALRESGKQSLRVRLLPAPVTVWLIILLGLFRRTSYLNLLEKLDSALWMMAHWTHERLPSTTALTGALLDRLTHRVHIIEANGESYRLRDSKERVKRQRKGTQEAQE